MDGDNYKIIVIDLVMFTNVKIFKEMKLSQRVFMSMSKSTSRVNMGFVSITEYYDQRKILTEKLLNLIDETNTSMKELYTNPRFVTLYNCSNELSRIENRIPEVLSFNGNIESSQVEALSSKIKNCKNELLETFQELESLELKKQRFLTNTATMNQ